MINRSIARSVNVPSVVSAGSPPDLSSWIEQLFASLAEAQRRVARVDERIGRQPAARALSGWRLSREEDFALRAQGASFPNLTLLGSDYDEYTAFEMICFDGQERRCFINPALEPRTAGRVAIRFGVCPEELDWRELRSEQQEFFGTYFPDVAVRFRRE
jgi:hypothetical protein